MYRIFVSISLMIIWIAPTYTSSYGPGLIFHKPASTAPYLTQFSMNFSYGQTNQSYDRHGKVVPFLQEYGAEDIVKRFVDTIHPASTEKLGSIKFNGTLHFERLNLNLSKNIHHNLFIGIGTSLQNLSITDITMQTTLLATLTPDEQKGLDLLYHKIPSQIDSAGMYTTSISFGYNKMFDNFENLEYVHLYLKGNIATPQKLSHRYSPLFQYPLAGNITFSYPLTAILELGINQHTNVGFFGIMVPFQPTTTFAFINNSSSNDDLLLVERAHVKVQPKPVFSGTLYLESHNYLKNLDILWAVGSAYGMNWHMQPIDTMHISTDKINKREFLQPWYICSMLVQMNYSFQSQKKPHAPFVSLFYVLPLTGSYFPKMSTFGGFYSLAFTYPF